MMLGIHTLNDIISFHQLRQYCAPRSFGKYERALISLKGGGGVVEEGDFILAGLHK